MAEVDVAVAVVVAVVVVVVVVVVVAVVLLAVDVLIVSGCCRFVFYCLNDGCSLCSLCHLIAHVCFLYLGPPNDCSEKENEQIRRASLLRLLGRLLSPRAPIP